MAWCEMVSVTPEVSSSKVLMVGIGNGPMVVKFSTVPAGPILPHCPVKSGQITLWSRSASHGMVMLRA